MAGTATTGDGNIAIYGLEETKRAMRQLAPDLRKEMDKTIRGHVKPVQSYAKTLVPDMPLSRWNDIPDRAYSGRRRSVYKRWEYDRLLWNPAAVKKGISVRQGGRRQRGQAVSAAWKIVNRSAAGAVFELSGMGKSTDVFVRNMPSSSGGRLIWRAWEARGRGIDRKIADTVSDFEREFTRYVDRMGA